MVSKTDSNIEIVKKVTYVYIIGNKAVLYLCFSSSFLLFALMMNSSIPHSAAVVAAPILKLCPEYLVASMPAAVRAPQMIGINR